jgi:hypothetical protein
MRIGYLDPSGAYVEVGDSGKPRRGKSKSSNPDVEKKAWVEFRYGKNREPLGYFWGPGHDRAGQPAHFGVDPP